MGPEMPYTSSSWMSYGVPVVCFGENGCLSEARQYRYTWFSSDSKFVPSQRETALLCNDVPQWLGAYLKSDIWFILIVVTALTLWGEGLSTVDGKYYIAINPNGFRKRSVIVEIYSVLITYSSYLYRVTGKSVNIYSRKSQNHYF